MLEPIILKNTVPSYENLTYKTEALRCIQEIAGFCHSTNGFGYRRTFCHFEAYPSIIKAFENRNWKFSEDKEINDFIDSYRDKVIFLKEMDSSILINQNFLVALLVRIMDVVNKSNKSMSPMFTNSTDYTDFNRFIKEVAMCWEGNLKQRSPNLDCESYGAALQKVEERRVYLDGNFNTQIRNISRFIQYNLRLEQEPVFILPALTYLPKREWSPFIRKLEKFGCPHIAVMQIE